VWRTGANSPTKIKFSNAVKIGDKEVAAGEYVLLSIPTADSWTLIFSKDAQMQSAGDYKEENDAARVTAKPSTLPAAVETFTIGFSEVKGASATMHLDWDKTRVSVPVSTNDIERVAQQLSSGTAPLDARTAYQAATFYLDNGKDMAQAAKWIDQAIEKNPDAYFMHMRRAQIQQKLGNKKEAIASAQKTIDILNKDKAPDTGAIATAQLIIDASK
jgi:tetratricopeptide (TPR) repeat protein